MSTFIRSDVVIDADAVVADYETLPDAVIDLNFETGKFWYAGVLYSSVAQIISAGHGTNTGGVQVLNLPALPAAFSIWAKGVCGVPAASYMMSLDDGDDGMPTDNMIAVTQSVSGVAGVLMFASGVNQLSTAFEVGDAAADGVDLSVAACFELNDVAASFNGTPTKDDPSATIPPGLVGLVVGNRRDGLRPWTGTLKRIVVIAAKLSKAQLVELAG